MRKQYSNSIYQKAFMNQSPLSRSLSIVNNNQNNIFNSYIPQNNMLELNDIFELIVKDSNAKCGPYNSVKILSLYIRKNRNSIEETINKVSRFLDLYKNLNVNLVLNIINSFLVILIEKSQIMSFLNKILPILVKRLFSNNIQNLAVIEKISNTIGNLIKIGGIYIRRLLATFTENLFKELNNFDSKNNKNDNFFFCFYFIFM